MNRKFLAAPLLLIPLLVAAVSTAGASTDGVGQATTSISIVSASVRGDDGKLVTVDVGTGSGKASTIPSGLAAKLAFAAAQTPVSVNSSKEIGAVTATVDPSECSSDPSNPSKCTSTNTPTLLPFSDLSPDAPLAGSVTFAGAEARLNPPLYAKAALGQATVTATLFNGFVQASGIAIGAMSNESTATVAEAIQGVSIGNVTVLRMGDLLDVVGPISSDQLLALAESVGGDATSSLASQIPVAQGALSTAQAALSNALAQRALCDLLPTLLVDLKTPCIDATQPLVDTLNAQIDVLNTLINNLFYGPDGLDQKLRGLPFISINDLSIGAIASAYGDHATASAVGSWGSIQVVGTTVDVPAPNPYDRFQEFSGLVATAVNAFNDATKRNLRVDLTPLATTAEPSVDSDGYQVADSSVQVLGITVYLAPPSQPMVNGAHGASPRMASSGTPLADVQIGGLQSHAMHKDLPDTNGGTGCTDPNGCTGSNNCTSNCTTTTTCTSNCTTTDTTCTSNCDTNILGDNINGVNGPGGSNGPGGRGGGGSGAGLGSPNNHGDADTGLAFTGENPLLAYCGLLCVALALGLRRWLGDAA
jgi:hypothetical protein